MSDLVRLAHTALFEHTSDGVLVLDARSRLVEANAAAQRLLGESVESLRGRPLSELLPEWTPPEPPSPEVPSRDGEWVWHGTASTPRQAHVLRVRWVPLPEGRVVLLRDVTAQAELESSLRQQHDLTELRRLHEQELAHLRAIQSERERADQLLLNILPKPVADRLKNGQRIIVENFPDVTVLFADLVDFTRFAAQHSPPDVLQVLNMVFSIFDQLTDELGVEKVKTIGDAYMAVGGLSLPRSDHAEAMAELALAMRAELLKLGEQLQIPLHLRIGLHSGPVTAGVISGKKFAYDLWGDTVNTASRMESHGVADGIHLSEAVHERLGGRYHFQDQGVIQVKGKGPMRTWLLLGAR